jgi:hypothetical protein
MRSLSRSSITALLAVTLAAPAAGCIQADDVAEDLDPDLTAVEEDPEPDDTGVSALYCPQGKKTDVIKTVTWPDYPVFGGASATAPDASYWNDEDGTFTMRAGGILGMPFHTTASAAYSRASDFNNSTQAACQDLFLGYEIWAYRASTGCYEYIGAGSRRGVWTVVPYTGTHCSLHSPSFEIDTDVYSFVKVSAYAYTNTPFPHLPNIHVQTVLRPTTHISADFE